MLQVPALAETLLSAAADSFRFEGSRTACLLLHGFTASPEEMRFLGERLHARGYSVSGIRIAGHGTRVEDLDRTRWEDWYTSARTELLSLSEQAERVVVVGQSMGALLALRLAAELPAQVHGLTLLAPAIQLTRRWLPWVRRLLPLAARRRPYMEKGDSGDIADAQARADRVAYRQIPVRALHQLLLLQASVRPMLARVRQPSLVIQSRQDHTCAMAGVEILRRSLGGRVETLILDDSFHVVSVDVDREQVATRVAEFVATIADQPR